ncbi:MAG: mevalonate kinase [Chloroflexi bacterium]|nr:mevalonate kinase [Chloroflexota bacterium]MCI0576439.1 mevalonate kinase [Chloroflexota bacterium]MCI0648198.1 mevalonate kinase [Chloroflexota bacterium]MCI0729583.1 mevalonate kinase [Chloroflexota bacterium]
MVYGRPAIAAPVTQVRATAVVEDSATPGVRLRAPDLGRDYWLEAAAEDDPFARAGRAVAEAAGRRLPDLVITVQSTIPIASGLGSGAAMAAAVIRALARHLGASHLAEDEQVSALTYEVEKLLHGTPSGIDNTVVAFERPVYFVRRQPQNLIETFQVATPLHLLVADTGQASATGLVVGDVRRQWQAEPARFEALFDGCGRVAEAARPAIEQGEVERLGRLMAENQAYLQEMTVSSPELERLIAAALAAGALGAKLSGAGRGGNMITLIRPEQEAAVREALLAAGARSVLATVLR